MRDPMRITADRRMIIDTVCGDVRLCERAEARARELVRRTKREVERYQALLLAHFAMQTEFGSEQPLIIEVGTALGYSAATMAVAAAGAHIFTINPKEHEVEEARRTVGELPNISIIQLTSVDFLTAEAKSLRDSVDLVFVDGDHAKVHRDFAFLWTLRLGGLLLFHDYSPAGSSRPCPPVFNGVNKLAGALGRDPDVLLVDDVGVGMAGFYRQEGDDEAAVGALVVGMELDLKAARAPSKVIE